MSNEIDSNEIRLKNISFQPPAEEFHNGFTLNLPDFNKIIRPGKVAN